MNRQGILILLIWIGSKSIFGQQAPLQSLAIHDLYHNNIAYAGLGGEMQFFYMYRNQWPKWTGQSQQQYLDYQLPLNQWKGAAGIRLEDDKLGLEHRNGLDLSYNYVHPGQNLLISAGIGVGFKHNNLNGAGIITPEGDYGNGQGQHNDPWLSSSNMGMSAILSQYAIYIQSAFLDGGIELSLPTFQKKSNPFQYAPNIQWILNKSITKENFDFTAYLAVFSDFKKWQDEINLQISKNGNIFGGFMLRGYNKLSFDAIGINGGFKLVNGLDLFLQIEIPISDRLVNAGNSQELGIRYNLQSKFGKYRKPKIIYNPRWSD